MYKSEQGMVMVVAALMMVALLASAAISIDVGQFYLTKYRLQAAADAAAIAGTYTLINNQNPALADVEAQKYVTANISGPYQYNSTANLGINTFQVNLTQNVSFFFAPAVGIKSAPVSTSAIAGANTVVSIAGVVPLGVAQQQFEFNKQYTLKYGGGEGNNGNFGALALGGRGGNTYRDNLINGYKEAIRVGDVLEAESGNKAGPTNQGVSARISACHDGCSYLKQINSNCSRVIIAPVVDGIVGNGRNADAKVKGFAAFFLEAANGNGDVTGVFLKWAASGEGGDGNNFGLVCPKLIK